MCFGRNEDIQRRLDISATVCVSIPGREEAISKWLFPLSSLPLLRNKLLIAGKRLGTGVWKELPLLFDSEK